MIDFIKGIGSLVMAYIDSVLSGAFLDELESYDAAPTMSDAEADLFFKDYDVGNEQKF